MKSKLLLLMLVSSLSIFLTGAASAVSIGTIDIASIPSNINHDAGSLLISFNITNTGAEGDVDLTLTLTSGTATSISMPASIHLSAGLSGIATASINFPAHQSGILAGKFVADPVGSGTPKEKDFSIIINDAPALVLTADKTTLNTKENVNLKVENTGNIPLNIVLSSSGDFGITMNPSSFVLNAGETKEGINATLGDLSALEFGDHTATITAKDSAKAIESKVNIVFAKSFCKAGESGGNLSISRIRIESDGQDEKEWRPLDTITVEVDVKNEGDKRIDDVIVEFSLFDSDGKDQSGDLNFENEDEEKIDLGNIGDGDKEIATFKFKISPDLAKGDYKLAIKTYSEDLGETVECTSESDDLDNTFYQDIEVLREGDENRFIVFDNLEVSPSGDATCGDEITVTADVYNIGDEDQDQVKITMISPGLGLKEEKIIKDLFSDDSTRISFNFEIPTDVEDKTYVIELGAEYDYRSGTYRESSDEPADFALKVIGCSVAPPENSNIAVITASSETNAKAGEDFVVKARVTSLLSKEADFVVNAAGFESWAELDSISERLIHLKSGESKEVLITLKINEDASGARTFAIEAISGGNTQEQEVQANIGSGSETPGFELGGNNLIWVIGIINVILIILIIVVAIRISRK